MGEVQRVRQRWPALAAWRLPGTPEFLPLIVDAVPLQPRILLIEDDPTRIAAVDQWLTATEFRLVVARSGGQALGFFAHGVEGVAGLMLDHDLSDSPLTDADRLYSTSDVMPVILRTLPKQCPVLIHSHNTSKPVVMQRALVAARFTVTRVRFATLMTDKALFLRWLDDVRDNWDGDQ